MQMKHINRYAPLAVGLQPSAMRCEARLHGLYRTECLNCVSVGQSGGRLPERIRTHQRGRGSALRTFSPTLERRAGRRTAA